MKKIGVFGGTFNPIHYGHLVLAEHVRDISGLDRVILLPANISPFKGNEKMPSGEERVNMARLAVGEYNGIAVSDFEVKRGGFSYTYDLLELLAAEFDDVDKLYFIAGADSVLEMEKWRDSEKMLSKYGIIAGTRPGFDNSRLMDFAGYLKKKYGTDIEVDEVPLLDISSTDIRERCASGRSVKYLLPDAVIDYIAEKGFYHG